MRTDFPIVVKRLDYLPPSWLVDEVQLTFELDPQRTRVVAKSLLRSHPDATGAVDIVLDGDALTLHSVAIDDRTLGADDYTLTDAKLVLHVARLGQRANAPTALLRLTVVTEIAPAVNSTLSGLYQSNGNYFTQCEAEGFRRITFFPDRPDVMARYSVTIRAARDACPVLLSNGNLVSQRALDASEAGGRTGWHEAVWVDPFPKPSYLFALVAGNLVTGSERRIRTMSGRDALLQVWVEPGDEDKTDWAMASLERAIRWDEARFGLELDLERFMIVAVGDFNMGAMENKGLNVFNTRYVFADPRIATDTDYANVESVVGHEYFHNWTGNRVTCRDWFQLTLKEGLTVFRDQEFSADVLAQDAEDEAARASARAVKRIEDVRVLRTAQFPEDAGPMAHPIRPDAYQEINNFYTVTVYEKGGEVIRMLQTLVGREGFRRGMDLYFERHDGQAVTCDDFVAAIADANGRDLSRFARWYAQAGTPRIEARDHYDAATRTWRLTLRQMTPPTPGQPDKLALHVPFAVGLLGSDGRALPLRLAGESADAPAPTTRVLELTEDSATFEFVDVPADPASDGAPAVVAPDGTPMVVPDGSPVAVPAGASRIVPSLLRDFSAPVIVDYPYDNAQLAFLLAHDTDPFNRWEASQRLGVACVRTAMEAEPTEPAALDVLHDAWARVLDDAQLSPAFKELVLTLPSEGFVAEQLAVVDPQAVRAARNRVRAALGARLARRWREAVTANETPGPYRPDATPAGRRALRNLALAYLAGAADAAAGDPQAVRREAQAAQAEIFERLVRADNMTDRLGAIGALLGSDSPRRDEALAHFAGAFAVEPLAMDKWFTLQATMHRQPGDAPVIERVRALMGHPAFSLRNPNKVRALMGAFCSGNLAEFHATDGSGYAFWVEQVLALDATNPQLAARMARALDRWRKFAPERQAVMRAALSQVAGQARSPDVLEVVGKALA